VNQINVSNTGIVDDVAVERSFLMRVYAWMALALLISAGVAYSTAVAPELVLLPLLGVPGGMLILFGVQLALVLGLSFGLTKLNASGATGRGPVAVARRRACRPSPSGTAPGCRFTSPRPARIRPPSSGAGARRSAGSPSDAGRRREPCPGPARDRRPPIPATPAADRQASAAAQPSFPCDRRRRDRSASGPRRRTTCPGATATTANPVSN